MDIRPIANQLQGLSGQMDQLKGIQEGKNPFRGLDKAVNGFDGMLEQAANKQIDISELRDNGAFADYLKSAIDSVDQAQKTANQKVEDVVSGKSDNIHDAMISMEQAQLSFSLMLEIRNKMVETYQELSRMQI